MVLIEPTISRFEVSTLSYRYVAVNRLWKYVHLLAKLLGPLSILCGVSESPLVRI